MLSHQNNVAENLGGYSAVSRRLAGRDGTILHVLEEKWGGQETKHLVRTDAYLLHTLQCDPPYAYRETAAPGNPDGSMSE